MESIEDIIRRIIREELAALLRCPRSTPPSSSALMTLEQVAEQLQVPVATIRKWREKGYGPHALKVGKYLRFRTAEVDSWLDGLSPAT